MAVALPAHVDTRSRWQRVKGPTLLAVGLLTASVLLHVRDPHRGGSWGYCPWLVLTGTWIIMVVAYAVRKLPFSVRSSTAIMHQLDPSLEEASINLGVPPFKTFLRIMLPLMVGGIVGAFVLTFVTIASELSSTVVLYSGPWTTMTVVMFQALEGNSPGVGTSAASTGTTMPSWPAVSPSSRS